MNKKELVNRISARSEMTQTAARRALDRVVANMTKAMRNGEKVTISGFGSFRVADRAEQVGRNPQTGEKITIAARRVVKFSPAKKLADRVK
ncbi:MAG TPA: HU family DNA-binding protein [Desulfopila sp.]|nr:HU family DNA-binding protein [Desulfopila sp.]